MDSKYIDIIYKELSARMTYGLKVQCDDYPFTFDEMHMGIGMLYTDYYGQPTDTPKIILSGCFYGNDIKPYLFPLSSMTEEQCEEFRMVSGFDADLDSIKRGEFSLIGDIAIDCIVDAIDWFNKNHFDYRELIPLGLAIDATGLGIYK
jgi:hypothetical protein